MVSNFVSYNFCLTYGVPQESTLGPNLLNYFILLFADAFPSKHRLATNKWLGFFNNELQLIDISS